MIDDDTFEMPTETALNLPSQDFLRTFAHFDAQIDGDILERAWKSYDATQQQILLEGNPKAWMVCSFYTAVWHATPYGRDEPPYLYSLWQLLKTCDVSVLEFFDKLTKWVEMINGPRRLHESVNRVQSTLAVSIVIYKKYLPIFRSMFRVFKSTEEKKMPMTTAKLFEYIWVTFVALKKLLPSGLEDLLNSFHILLCVIDLITEELRHINSEVLNPEFMSLMDKSGTKSTLDFLCQQFDGVELDAKHMLVHWVMPKLKIFQERGIIVSKHSKNSDNATEIALLAHWITNLTNLSNEYEHKMMQRAEIDERMFISHVCENVDMVFNESLDDSAMTMLRRGNLDSSWAVDADLLLRMSTQRCMEKVQLSAKPLNTPLSSRSYIISSEQFCPATPLSASTYRLQKLHDLFDRDYKNADSDLHRLIAQCRRDNPKAFIVKKVEALEQAITKKIEDEKVVAIAYDEAFASQLSQRLSNTEMLFYRLLQKTVLYDRQRNPRAEVNDLSSILQNSNFIASLYICSLEIVFMTYGSERDFPWSIDALPMPAVNFYKIIEVVVRAEPELSRDMVKHLNRCEERVLEELSWATDSPLWAAIARRADGVPSCAAVTNEGVSTTPRGVAGQMPSAINIKYTSSSPMKPIDRSSVKRRLEFGEDDGLPRKKAHDEGYSLPSGTTLFFRKVYYLAAIRLTDLCDRIRMDEPIRTRVWTLFEHVLRTETSLMLGRHIDQNLMCCLYITLKISNTELSFHKIMQHYKLQPQASSRIYRQVLAERSGAIGSNTLNADDGASRDSIGSFSGQGTKLRSGSAVPQPGQASAPPTPEPQQMDYIDLIKYYNRIFVPRVEDFVKKLHPTNSDSKENIVTINPMPKITCTTLSPRRNIGDQMTIIPMSSLSVAPRRATTRIIQ